MDDEKDIEIEDLFTENGMYLHPIATYFDKWGNVSEQCLIIDYQDRYPANSDLVKLRYAQRYADETNSNYTALKLFKRAYFELFEGWPT